MLKSEPVIDLDSPEFITSSRDIILRKPLLRAFYCDVYSFFSSEITSLSQGVVLELGSGGGFLREFIPDVVTSDIVNSGLADVVFDATQLPLRNQSLSAIVMLNVFHHLKDVAAFLTQASSALEVGGRIIMVEPANTIMSRFIYKRFHHEPFDTAQDSWGLPPGGAMSGANQALPWIVFERDREQFFTLFPALKIVKYEHFGPLLYPLSGGLSRPAFVPGSSSRIISLIEAALSPFNRHLGLFSKIVIEKS